MSHLHAVARGGATHEVVVVSAGTSEQSTSTLLGRMLGEAALETEQLAGARLTVVELRPLAHAVVDALLTGFASGELAEAQDAVRRADALVVVSPVHSASFSALFKGFFDALETGALDGTPVLVAATAGSERHSLVLDHALRPLFGYLRAVVVPTGIFAAAGDWGSGETGAGGIAVAALRRRVTRAAGELAALVTGRATGDKRDSFDRDVASMPSFEDLLRG